MPVLLPERTVDSLFAYEFLTAAPRALIWSPANNHVDNRGLSPDHKVAQPEIDPTGAFADPVFEYDRQLVFECKTLYATHAYDHSRPDALCWYIEVPYLQLLRYVRRAPGTLYLFPSDCRSRERPWATWYCCTESGNCAACPTPNKRRWAALRREEAIARLPRFEGFQPWFSHWSWCVTAADLLRYIVDTDLHKAGFPVATRSVAAQKGAFAVTDESYVIQLDAADDLLKEIPGAQRFCHLLDGVARDATGRWTSVRASEGLDEPEAGEPPVASRDGHELILRITAERPPRELPADPESTTQNRLRVAYRSYRASDEGESGPTRKGSHDAP